MRDRVAPTGSVETSDGMPELPKSYMGSAMTYPAPSNNLGRIIAGLVEIAVDSETSDNDRLYALEVLGRMKSVSVDDLVGAVLSKHFERPEVAQEVARADGWEIPLLYGRWH